MSVMSKSTETTTTKRGDRSGATTRRVTTTTTVDSSTLEGKGPNMAKKQEKAKAETSTGNFTTRRVKIGGKFVEIRQSTAISIGLVRTLGLYNGASLRSVEPRWSLIAPSMLAHAFHPDEVARPTDETIANETPVLVCDSCLSRRHRPMSECHDCRLVICAHGRFRTAARPLNVYCATCAA